MAKLLIDNRSRYLDIEVEALVQFGFESVTRLWPINNPIVRVRVTNTIHCWQGSAYVGGGLVIIRVGKPERFLKPQRISYDRKWKEMPEYFLNDYRECMVYIAAHEFSHTSGKGGRKAGEFSCELAGQDAVDEFRKVRAGMDALIAAGVGKALRRARGQEKRAAAAVARRGSPEWKLARKLAQLAVWQRKRARAETAIRKLARGIKALNRKLAAELDKAAAPKD